MAIVPDSSLEVSLNSSRTITSTFKLKLYLIRIEWLIVFNGMSM